VLALVLLPLLASPPPAAPVSAAAVRRLESELSRISDDSDGTLGAVVVDVASGTAASLGGGDRFPMASVMKLPVAVAVLKKVDGGAVRIDERIAVGRGDLRPFSPIADRWKPGLSLAVGELIDDMIVASDNTAVDLLIRRLGGTSAVRESLAGLGLAGIEVDATELEMILRFRGIREVPPDQKMTPETLKRKTDAVPEAERMKAEFAFEKSPVDVATPEALARLLVRLWKRELLSAPSTDRLFSAMKRCATGDRRIRAGVPKGSEVFDKTGTIGRSANDVGIVRLPNGRTLAVVVLLKNAYVGEAEREAVSAKVAKAAAAAFGP